MPGWKWTKLTLSQKVNIIEKSKKADFCADSRKNMCHEYGITDPVISLIMKNQKEILAAYDLEVSTGQKTIIKAAPTEIENSLHEWLINQCNKKTLVNGAMLMNRASDLHSKSNVKFSFCGGWFEDFIKRYEIQFLQKGDSELKSYHPNPNFKNDSEAEFVHKLKKASIKPCNDGSK